MERISIFAALLLGASSFAQASEPNGADIFVKSVFRAEVADDDVDFTDFLAARFRRAVELDRREGEIGLLDHDPVCMCQDAEGMHFSIVAIRNTPNGVNVTIRAGRQVGKWQLAREGGHWKIADISEVGWMKGASILKALELENKRGR